MEQTTVFYSWQSDLPNATNRSFIEQALGKAIAAVRSETALVEDLALDRDTKDVAGSPDIADTIFEKIKASFVFVCDVSIINKGTEHARPTPNPNVLIELGFAVSQLGWDRIICVFNTATGTIEDLPFDIRPRRVLTYRAAEGEADRAAEKSKLAKTLQSAIQSIVNKTEGRKPGLEVVFQRSPFQRFGVRNTGGVPIELLRFVVEFPRRVRGASWSPNSHPPVVTISEFYGPDGESMDRLSLVKTDAPLARGYSDYWRLPPQIDPGETLIFEALNVMFKQSSGETNIHLRISARDMQIEKEISLSDLFISGGDVITLS